MSPEVSSEASSITSKPLKIKKLLGTLDFDVLGSLRVLSGAQRASLGEPLYLHDIIKFTLKCKENIFAISKEFYEKGANLKEIERLTGFPRSTIRTALVEGGVELREFKRSSLSTPKTPKVAGDGVAPFGFCYQSGELITDISEYKTVFAIIKLWQRGTALKAIVQHLNDQKIPTRHDKKWTQELVKKIIKRHEKEKNKKAM